MVILWLIEGYIIKKKELILKYNLNSYFKCKRKLIFIETLIKNKSQPFNIHY